MLRNKNAFISIGGFVYVDTLFGDLGVQLENNNLTGNEDIMLTHHTPNLYFVYCEDTYYKFKVGKRYVRITSDGCITLTVFRKFGTRFLKKPVHVVECDNCLFNYLFFGWLRKYF